MLMGILFFSTFEPKMYKFVHYRCPAVHAFLVIFNQSIVD